MTKTIRRFELMMKKETISENNAIYDVAAKTITGPDKVAQIAREFIGKKGQENFLAFYLNSRHKIIGYSAIGKGGFNSCGVDVKVIFYTTIKLGASALVCVHNHPSGNLEPSPEDKALTTRIKDAGDLLNISLLDHVIVADNGHVSLKERLYF